MMVLDFFHVFLGVVVKFLLLLQLSDYKWSNYFRKSRGEEGGLLCITGRDYFFVESEL